ncbi:tripartite motif-containing protein 10-like isoform X1 [Podarcis lilfordi]|uniref:Tripartite motif-containing protein 10-like isoform X1 n=2 Tax=Podarcis lilfordi TaxID=74358 RepID=A0AA35K0W9_9SAUR|nr:tripartite motif-containing protein 10-like isoform X1 [Podarcis lilfordi]
MPLLCSPRDPRLLEVSRKTGDGCDVTGFLFLGFSVALCFHTSLSINKAANSSPTMASAPPSVDMDQDALCPICKDYLTDPVTLDCGHNYCQGCVTNYCKIREEQAMGHLECPICRAQMQRGSFRPNWQLASIVEKIKLLQLNKGGKDMCVKHKKYLELFCKEDEKLVCVACERSPEHKSHTVVLEEEAAQEYKGLLCSHLEILRKERETILAYQADTEKESQDLLKLTETERQKIVEKFRKLYRFLEEQEVHLLNQIEEVEKEIEGRRDEHLARLSRELSSLKKLIQEMEDKSQQAASELLQDVRSTLQRCCVIQTTVSESKCHSGSRHSPCQAHPVRGWEKREKERQKATPA